MVPVLGRIFHLIKKGGGVKKKKEKKKKQSICFVSHRNIYISYDRYKDKNISIVLKLSRKSISFSIKQYK